MDLPKEKICPGCLSSRMKAWDELSGDEKMLAEKLPLSAELPSLTRKRHLFCTRCWFEQPEIPVDT